MEITLAYALKLKKRLIGRIADIDREVTSSNVFVEGKPKLSIRDLIDTRGVLSDALCELKTAIAISNAMGSPSIVSLINEKDELVICKSLFSKIPTEEPFPYGNQDVKYSVSMDKLEIRNAISMIQREIESIQDKIDSINKDRKVKIEFDPDTILSMV